MKRLDWKWTIRRNIFLLKILGLWPEGDDSYKLNLYSLYSFIILVLFVCGQNLFQLMNIYFYPDYEDLAGTIFMSLSELLTIPKAFYVIVNMKGLKQLMLTLNSDLFQPNSCKQIDLITPNLNFWNKSSIGLWIVTSGAIVGWSLFPVLDKSEQGRRLPAFAWYPYNYEASPWYELTYAYQMISVSTQAAIVTNVDLLLAALNMYIGAQCDLLCDNLRHFNSIPENSNDKLVLCIQQHREILKFAENSNKYFDRIILSQFLVSAASFGITLFRLTVVPSFSTEFYSVICFAMAVLTQIFVYCWFGNEVIIKSNNIPNAIFESEWLDVSLETKKNLVFLIRKCQEPIRISSLNLFHLSLETFTNIIRASWSYFALFYQAVA